MPRPYLSRLWHKPDLTGLRARAKLRAMNPSTPLSPHFTLGELCRSDLALRRGIRNLPGPASIHNLSTLCAQILEPLRAALGPVVITSGYRSPELNRALGSTGKSQHQYGQAADLLVPGHTPLEVCRWLYASALPFDQLIYEGTWVHVSIAAVGDAPRREVLTAQFKGGTARYLAGLVAPKAA